jgi:hypothetical protein
MDKAIYAPGELDKIKGRLGPVDAKEAKRLQKVLGGEVGRERTEHEDTKLSDAAALKAPDGKEKNKRIVEVLETNEEDEEEFKRPSSVSVPIASPHPKYSERVKMDACCADIEFGIKTAFQSLVSRFSFFKAPKDKISPHFVKSVINEYYKQVEIVVRSVRLMLPRNNTERDAEFKKVSPFAFSVLNVLRQWKLSVIASEIVKFQMHPRNVYLRDFPPVLREFYKPLMLLEKLSIDEHIQVAFEKLYKMLFLENPSVETEKLRGTIADALSALEYTRSSIYRFLYPLLMKMISDTFLSCEEFFGENRTLILAFLGLGEDDIIAIPSRTEQKTNGEEESRKSAKLVPSEADNALIEKELGITEGAGGAPQRSVEKKQIAAAQKVVDKGLSTLELLFPSAGWKDLGANPDLYPYFADILDLKKTSEIISPLDPAQLALVLSRIISELSFGLRSIQFSFKFGEDDYIAPILDQWQKTLEESFYNSYIPKIDEYAHLYESSRNQRAKTTYSMNLLNDIHWARRYYLFPHYDYKSGIPPSFSKKNINSLYFLVRELRKLLTELAEDIDAVKRSGGVEAGAVYLKTKNVEAPYNFEIDNPLSKRLDMLLPKRQRTNISLIFFTLAVCAVLDDHLNNPASPAYQFDREIIFRSVNNGGNEPVLWVEKRTDVEDIFKKSIMERKGKS